jgi:hypothetical protein
MPTISMRVHLVLDALGGIVLAASPWLFQFHEYVWMPHVVFGLLEFGAAAMTQTTPGRSRIKGANVGIG